MGRKNLLADLVAAKPDLISDPAAVGAAITTLPALGARGVVGAMSRSLEAFSAERDAAKAIGKQMAAGVSIVEIDPALIDSSFVTDRLAGMDEDYASLVAAIRTQGQQVPVLLRPHPARRDRFQIAYGHRRVRALAEIGRPVRAVLRELSDAELVVAQGQENSARKDLSFIERACFATALEDRGFTRDVIMAALTVDKTELSRLIAVRRSVPATIVALIGPAPKTGRRRWMDLADRLDQSSEPEHVLARLQVDPQFAAGTSDQRFQKVHAALSLSPEAVAQPGGVRQIEDGAGRPIARVDRGQGRLTIAVDDKAVPDFGAYLVERLPALFQEFSAFQISSDQEER